MTISRTISRPDTLSSTGNRLHFGQGHFSVRASDALNDAEPTWLFGLPLANASLEDAARAIVQRATNGTTSIIQFINAHCVNMLAKDADYGRALSHADDLLPDGSGVRLAARFCGLPSVPNLNGTDLFPLLCQEAADQRQPLFLLGGGFGVAAAAASAMRARVGRLEIAGTHHGFWEQAEEEALIQSINASGATILLVGLGVPLQEIWIARNRHRISVPVILGVGGLFDYYSGRIPRAPLAMRKLGLEWCWRLLQEPRRMAGRYLLGNPEFMLRTLALAWKEGGHAERYTAACQRMLDLTVALGTLLVFSPLILAICALIKMEDGGPVFFRQLRIGGNGKPFAMWKFRSMRVDAEKLRQQLLAQSDRDSICFKMKRDPRITGVGRWLRRLSLDELPQLFNVVRGEMSVVGPRPALPQEVVQYGERERGRLLGRPGLTCTWQVSGRAEIEFAQQVELDIAYLQSRSLWRDITLLFRTIPAVISGRGAY